MALLTRQEFASQTGQSTRSLSVYIKRGKVIVNKKDLIDTTNSVNQAFIATHAWRKPEKSKAVQSLPDSFDIEDLGDETNEIDYIPEKSATNGNIPDIIVSEKRYKHALAKKTEAAEELDRLRIEKLKGEVIPTAPIETLIFQFKQTTLTHSKTTYEKFLGEIAHKYSISPEDLAYFRGFFIKLLNASANEATDTFVRNLGVVLNEFSVKKRA